MHQRLRMPDVAVILDVPVEEALKRSPPHEYQRAVGESEAELPKNSKGEGTPSNRRHKAR